MAIEPIKYYWIYQIVLTDDQLDELEMMVNSGKAEYVAGRLIGQLRANGKIVVPESEKTTTEDN